MDELIADLDDGFIYTVAIGVPDDGFIYTVATGVPVEYTDANQICNIAWITRGQTKIIHLILVEEFSNQFGITRILTVNLKKRYDYSKDEWNKLITFLEDKMHKPIEQFEGKLHHVV